MVDGALQEVPVLQGPSQAQVGVQPLQETAPYRVLAQVRNVECFLCHDPLAGQRAHDACWGRACTGSYTLQHYW